MVVPGECCLGHASLGKPRIGSPPRASAEDLREHHDDPEGEKGDHDALARASHPSLRSGLPAAASGVSLHDPTAAVPTRAQDPPGDRHEERDARALSRKNQEQEEPWEAKQKSRDRPCKGAEAS
jgi:hypothetical protein